MRSLILFAVIGLAVGAYLYTKGVFKPGSGVRPAPTQPASDTPIAKAERAKKVQECFDACDQASVVDDQGDAKRRACRAKCQALASGANRSSAAPPTGAGAEAPAQGPTGGVVNPEIRSISKAPADHRGTKTGLITVSGTKEKNQR